MTKGLTNTKSVKLRVERLEKSRSGRSLCYVDQDVMLDLELNTGDIIEIRGKKKTAGAAVSSVQDRGKGIIRLDGLQRLNAGITIGEFVTIQLAEVYPAKEIVLTPKSPNIDLKRQAETIKGRLIDKPVVIGDIVDVLGTFVQQESGDNPMSDIMKMFQMGGKRRPTFGTLRLIVEKVRPQDRIVKVTRDTIIKVNKRVALLNVLGKSFSYNDIGGLSDEIQRVREIVELPVKHPELFQKLNISPPKGVLLYGIPGVGKTLLIKAISQETNINFITINGLEIFSRDPRVSEGRLHEIFKEAKENAPSIIFIDKIDVIAPKNANKYERRVIAQLLTLMDGIRGRGDVIVIAETHRLDEIDDALRRPGRFDREIEIKPPDIDGRCEILKIHTRGVPLHEDVDLQLIAERTQGFTGADLEGLVKEAAILAINEILPKFKDDKQIPSEVLNELQIKMEHFLTILDRIKPSTLN